jgi:hypothetical protein
MRGQSLAEFTVVHGNYLLVWLLAHRINAGRSRRALMWQRRHVEWRLIEQFLDYGKADAHGPQPYRFFDGCDDARKTVER